MNALDRKIDSMIQDYPRYDELQFAVSEMLRVMSRAHVIKFLKYCKSLEKAGK
jgi:hypothetical protein